MKGKCISRKFHLPSLGVGPHGWDGDGAPGFVLPLFRADQDRERHKVKALPFKVSYRGEYET